MSFARAGSSPVPGTFLETPINMNELKKQLVGIGLSEELADKAIAIVGAFVKSRIPRSCHSMIDEVLAGKSPDLSGLMSKLGGLFGK